MRFQLSLETLATPPNALALGFGTAIGPYIDFFYGVDRRMVFLAIFLVIILDWVTGIGASLKDKTYSSEYGLNGIFRTLFIFLFPVVANVLDQVMGTSGFLFYGVTIGLIYHTWNSMTANAIRAGWTRFIPKQIAEFVSSELKAKAERALNRKVGKEK